MLVGINKINISDRIRKDYGHLEELAEDIKENGLINPPVVTPNYELIAGERRLKACKLLKFQQIEVRVMSVRDYEHQLRMEISENENRKEFTFSERVDWARRLERVEKEKARQRMSLGGQGRENFPTLRARDVVAKDSGFGSGKQYEKAKYVAENATADVIQKLDENEISVHKAYTIIKNKLKEAEEKNKQLEESLQEEKKKTAIVETKIIEKEVDRTDYEKIEELQKELNELQDALNKANQKYDDMKEWASIKEKGDDEYKKLKEEIERLHSEQDDVDRQINSAISLSSLYAEIEHVLQNKLSPVKYSRALLERRDSKVAMENLVSIVEVVKEWTKEMERYLPNNNIIDAEVIG